MSQSEPLFFRVFKRHVPTALLDDDRLWQPHTVEWDCGSGAVADRVAAALLPRDYDIVVSVDEDL